ncbi:MAG TPA: hypothetical protein VJT50_04930 [Pyrinomonadaceae bacterium]|nr:hypothetical protein [Pyrinomonadaceae bacterium]
MDTKRSKYDTNPLDPNFVKEAEENWGEGGSGPTTQPVKGATAQVAPPSNVGDQGPLEAPTRRYDKATLEASYPSVFAPPTYSPPAPYYAAPLVSPPLPGLDRNRVVKGLGLSEKWTTMLPYTPFYIGVVVSILELFLVPRGEGKVRFHAAQGLALHVAILVLQTAFALISAITNNNVGSWLFRIAAFIFLLISMIRVWKGKPHHIGALAEPTKWFNHHIEARK